VLYGDHGGPEVRAELSGGGVAAFYRSPSECVNRNAVGQITVTKCVTGRREATPTPCEG